MNDAATHGDTRPRIDEACKRFTTESAYLDDRPAAPLRFLADANLSMVIRREEQHVDPAEARAQRNDRIRGIFDGKMFETVPFPGGPFDVPEEVGDGRPNLVVFAYDGLAVGETVDEVPELIERVDANKGADGSAVQALRTISSSWPPTSTPPTACGAACGRGCLCSA